MSYGNIINLLKENHKKNWLLYTKHDFVNKLSNDTLKEEKFLHYLTQDYLFLIQFSKAWALAILKWNFILAYVQIMEYQNLF